MKFFLAISTLLLLQLTAIAQDRFTISGTVRNLKGEKLQSATVFISGSEKIMMTDANGNYAFKINPGIYQIVVTMVGYNSLKKSVTINNQNESLDFKLADQEVVLNEVVIGGKINKKRKSQIEIFTRYFIGTGPYSKDCKILNTELLKFTEDRASLMATSSDFLVIENQALGYRIRYLLQFFKVAHNRSRYIYDGDYSFETLTGSAEQQAAWENNRKLAYQGSMMHYLRSIYAGTALKEGFVIYEVVNFDNPVIDFKPTPVFSEQIIKRTTDQLAEFRFGDNYFYVVFDKQKAAQEAPILEDKKKRLYKTERTGTVYKIFGKFDKQGSLEEYDLKSFFVRGYMTQKKVADQLPYEYNPE